MRLRANIAQCGVIRGVSVPLPGFSGLRLFIMEIYTSRLTGFSPVAGIQWVETVLRCMHNRCLKSFSPVAGIQWVETTGLPNSTHAAATGFSPVAGIQWVETTAHSVS